MSAIRSDNAGEAGALGEGKMTVWKKEYLGFTGACVQLRLDSMEEGT